MNPGQTPLCKSKRKATTSSIFEEHAEAALTSRIPTAAPQDAGKARSQLLTPCVCANEINQVLNFLGKTIEELEEKRLLC
eukprot:2448443-Rhodomonas_salina.3